MDKLQSIKQRYGIIGRSEKLDRALSTALRVANTDLTVLIQGESGVGKEIFSRVIHDNSARKHNKFIAINCGAIPEGTINSELFGHEKGAFTGATNERKGYFESYDGGTIFLDEVGEMPLDTQSYLLRVLETGEFIRVGSNKVQRTDIRVIAATNVDLQDRIKKGKFREDLYFRLNTVPIYLPALRERREDIPLLFRKFAVDFAERYRMAPVQLDESAMAVLRAYSWPGNIRELKNIAEQLSVLVEDREVNSEKLIQYIPNISRRHLPALTNGSNDAGGFQEREILYSLLFDMKNDLNDLKSLVYGLIKDNDLEVPQNTTTASMRGLRSLHSGDVPPVYASDLTTLNPDDPSTETPDRRDPSPIILEAQQAREMYDDMEEVEESLSLEEQEKQLIARALKKHNGRRKEAAQDLGISERTLYRKIKQYEL